MAQLSNYCKAYLAEELRQFPEWSEQVPPLVVRPEGTAAGENGTEYFFIHDDYVVTASSYRDEQVAFDHATPSWKEFCDNALNFKAPTADKKTFL